MFLISWEEILVNASVLVKNASWINMVRLNMFYEAPITNNENQAILKLTIA